MKNFRALNRKNRKASKRPRRTTTSTFKKKVQRIIDRQVEKKRYVITGANISAVTASGGGTPTALNLMPTLALGTNQEARVGEQVKIVKARVKGFINIAPYAPVSNPGPTPIKIKMWVVSSKLTNVITLGSTNVGTGFFEVGSDTTGFTGNMLDMMLPVNKQAWVVHHEKVFNLGATYASATGPVTTAGYYDNSRMSLPFSFEYGSKFKKPLNFSDDSSSLNGNYPYDRNCWLFIQPVYADGQASSGYAMAEYHYLVDIDYTDM